MLTGARRTAGHSPAPRTRLRPAACTAEHPTRAPHAHLLPARARGGGLARGQYLGSFVELLLEPGHRHGEGGALQRSRAEPSAAEGRCGVGRTRLPARTGAARRGCQTAAAEWGRCDVRGDAPPPPRAAARPRPPGAVVPGGGPAAGSAASARPGRQSLPRAPARPSVRGWRPDSQSPDPRVPPHPGARSSCAGRPAPLPRAGLSHRRGFLRTPLVGLGLPSAASLAGRGAPVPQDIIRGNEPEGKKFAEQ